MQVVQRSVMRELPGRQRRAAVSAGALFLFPVISAVAGQTLFEQGAKDKVYTEARQVRYSFTVQNNRDVVSRGGRLQVFAPVRETATQRCLEVSTSHAAELIAGKNGEQALAFVFGEIAPHGTVIVRVRVDLALATQPTSVPLADRDYYLQPEQYIECDHADIKRAAATCVGKTPALTARAAYKWVSRNIESSGYNARDHGALSALKSKQGDCSEMAYLAVALCRSCDLPARYMSGYVIHRNEILKPYNFHNWCEFHDGNSWRVLDPNLKIFMSKENAFVATRASPPTKDSALGVLNRFRIEGEGLVVRMNKD